MVAETSIEIDGGWLRRLERKMWLKGVNGSSDPHILDQIGKVSNHVKGI